MYFEFSFSTFVLTKNYLTSKKQLLRLRICVLGKEIPQRRSETIVIFEAGVKSSKQHKPLVKV